MKMCEVQLFFSLQTKQLNELLLEKFKNLSAHRLRTVETRLITPKGTETDSDGRKPKT